MKRPLHTQWLLALGAWTFFVWFQRIGNVLSADDLSGGGRAWRLAVALAFVVTAVVLVGGVALGRRRAGAIAWVSQLGVGLAAIGSLWWIVRGGRILIGDWDLSFKLVHTVLAIVVVGLSVMVWRSRGYDRPSYG